MKYLSIQSVIVIFTLSLGAAPVDAAPKSPVKVEMIQEGKLTSLVEVHGSIQGRRDVLLTSGIGGRLVYVAEPGKFVEQGELIAKMDLVPLQLEQAEQSLLIKRAQIQVDFQTLELARYQSLAKTDATAQYQIDLTENNLNLAKSDIELAKLKLNKIEDQISRASILAPFNGIIGKRYQQAGSEISRAQELVQFLDMSMLEVIVFLPVKYLDQINTNQTMTLRGQTVAGEKSAVARISAIIPKTDPRSQTFEVRARLQPTERIIWASGELVDVTVNIENATQVTLINRDALIIRKNGIHIVKIDENNLAIHVPVEVGRGQSQLVEVKSTDAALPIKEGDKIAIRGAERLQTGQEVDVQS